MHLLRLLSLATAIAGAAAHPGPARPKPFSSTVVFTPKSDSNTLYARNAQLPNGDLVATWENYTPEPPAVYFPIYRSSDYGKTWKKLSEVHDTANGLGLRYQPELFVLPERIGRFRAGTLLLAGNSIPTDLNSTHIDLYASENQGRTWKFLSHIDAGGAARPNQNNNTPIWEPFLMVHKGKLLCYYSTEKEQAVTSQKLVHRATDDLYNWGPVIDDVAYPTQSDRPGMASIARLPNGKFFLAYEYGGKFNTSSYSYPVYSRIADHPERFQTAEHHPIVVKGGASGGVNPDSSPSVVWTPWGGRNGTIVLSCMSMSSVLVNQALGEGEWIEVPTPEPISYTRQLRILKEDPKMLLIMGGGKLGVADNRNKVTVSSVNLAEAMAKLK